MPKSIFRQTALERLSSPEQLDSLMTVTTPKGWLGLAAAAVVIAGALVWGVVGRAPDTIDGAGILHREGGLFEVQSAGAGFISEVTVKPGDVVEVGQVVAHVEQLELEQAVTQAEDRLKVAAGASERERLAGRHQLELLQLQHDRTSSIRSPYRGRVIELQVDTGNAVQVGQPVLALELQDRPLGGYVFVPQAGKRIMPGMSVRITPSGVSWEEYGYVVGTVVSVSDAPVSPAAMNVILRNSALVQQFSAQGGVYLVEVKIGEDPSTPSGLKWTSHGGPPMRLGSGTLLTASITVREQRPITLIVPALRRWLGA
jgi:multidrug resistance efflux pump